MWAKLKLILGDSRTFCVYNNIHRKSVLTSFQKKQLKFATIKNRSINIESHVFMCSLYGLFALTSSENQEFRTQFHPLEQLVSQYKYEKINM